MFKPLNNRIVVRPDIKEKEKTTVSGIIVHDEKEKDEPETGVILTGTLDGAFEGGQRIAYSRLGRDELEVEGEKVHVVSINAILGIF